MNQVAFLLDLDRCIGCHACRVACQVHNDTTPEVNWRQVMSREAGRFPEVVQYNLSLACNHCERPACMAVCPTDVIVKRERDGIVFIDANRCNGCERCLGACPYGAPQRVPGQDRVSKCDFCWARQDAGLVPVCVETCVGGALQFGRLDQVEQLAAGRQLHRRSDGFFDPDWTRPAIRFIKAGVE
ncbi:MAG: 4Fe-4S dicluster domain-containing protein [Deltaproteobacteria bacterium]|nr:4Fe-4S dicluster domain-containing protein [Deltaproteobacteria bacterium]